MKQFYFLILSVVLFKGSFSAPVTTASSNGYRNSSSTWNLNRLPQVVIPVGKTVTISDDKVFKGFVYVKVYGLLKFQNNNSILGIDAPSIIKVFNRGEIVGGGSASQKIRMVTDKSISAKVVYYHIKEVGVDRKNSSTTIKSIKTNINYTYADIKIASVQNKVLLQFPKEIKGRMVVRSVSMNGVDQQTVDNALGRVVLNSKVKGNYVISVRPGS